MPATKNNSHPTLSYVTQLYDMKKNKRFKIRAVFFCKKSKKGIFLSHLHYYWRHFAFFHKKTRYVSHDEYLFSNKTSFTD